LHRRGCKKVVIPRDWFNILSYALTDSGHSSDCGTLLAGCYGKFGTPFGARRIPLRLR
jgi:pyruvate formate lyase activating enzyme